MEISKKSELRRQILAARNHISSTDEELQNHCLFQRLKVLDSLNHTSGVYLYMSCRHEADTGRYLTYLWEQNIPAAVPRVNGREIDFYYISSMEDVEPGAMGILEPKSTCRPACDRTALMIIPGLAFDRQGGRLGYGGGYYDRFFAREPEHRTAGIGFRFQMVEKVPTEPWDKQLDEIIIAD